VWFSRPIDDQSIDLHQVAWWSDLPPLAFEPRRIGGAADLLVSTTLL